MYKERLSMKICNVNNIVQMEILYEKVVPMRLGGAERDRVHLEELRDSSCLRRPAVSGVFGSCWA